MNLWKHETSKKPIHIYIDLSERESNSVMQSTIFRDHKKGNRHMFFFSWLSIELWKSIQQIWKILRSMKSNRKNDYANRWWSIKKRAPFSRLIFFLSLLSSWKKSFYWDIFHLTHVNIYFWINSEIKIGEWIFIY